MRMIAGWISRRPLVAFFVLSYAWTWPLAAMISVSLLLPLLGLFGPALAAIAVTTATEGRAGTRRLLGRLVRWRVHPLWYVVAVGLPLGLTVAAIALERLWGRPTRFAVGDFSPVSLVLAVLIVGEELGWRGFALPRLLGRRSPLAAALILGVLWALWHLPNFVFAGYPHAGRSLPAFIAATTAYSVLLAWLFVHTRGSVLLATLLHAAINLFSPTGIPAARHDGLEAGLYGAAAVVLALALGPNLGAPRAGRDFD